MADTHYELDQNNSIYAREFLDDLKNLLARWDRITAARAAMIQMKDNAQSGDSVYAKVSDSYGVVGADQATQYAHANAVFTELDTQWQACDTAIRQLCGKVGSKPQ